MRHAALACLLLAACGTDADDWDVGDEAPRWDCPAGWVPYDRGGCGPAVLLCVTGGGAAPGACEGAELGPPAEGEAPRLFLAADGTLGGAWPAPGDPGGPPIESFTPDTPAAEELGWAECPAGWTRDGASCAPTLTTCERGASALPGGDCTRTGAADCPAGDWPDAPAGVEVVHVRAGADASAADGSRDAPYATLSAGLAATPDGGAVLLAAGRYEEDLAVDRAVEVVGVCAERALVAGTAGRARATAAAGAELRLAGVTLIAGGLAAGGDARVTLEQVRIAGGVGAGVRVDGADTHVVLRDVLVRGFEPDRDGNGGYGIDVHGGAVEGERVVIERTPRAGLRAQSAQASLRLEASRIADVSGLVDVGRGFGVEARYGADVSLSSTLVERFDIMGILAADASRMTLSRVVVRDALREEEPIALAVFEGSEVDATQLGLPGGYPIAASVLGDGSTLRIERGVIAGAELGVQAVEGGRLEARETLLSNVPGTAVAIVQGQVYLDRSVVRDAATVAPGERLGCATMQDGGVLRLERSRFERCGSHGVFAVGGRVELVESVLADALRLPVPDGVGTAAIVLVGADASLEMSGSRITGARNAGVLLSAGARGIVHDSVIVDPHGEESGIGLWAEGPGTLLEADRVLVANALHFGLFAQDEGQLVFRDGVVGSTRPAARTSAGEALHVQSDAVARVERASFEDSYSTGMIVGWGEAHLTDVRVSNVTPSEDFGWGVGVFVGRGAEVTAERLLVQGVGESGISLLDAGTRFTGTDVLVRASEPTFRGYGFGVSVAGGAAMDVDRLAVVDVGGAALAALPFAIGSEEGLPANVVLRDGFFRGVRSSPIQFVGTGTGGEAGGGPVAYGLHAVDGSSVMASRTVLDEGGYGFYQANGEIRLEQAVISRQLDATGASLGGSTTVESLHSRDNADDVRDAGEGELPAATALPPPTPVCVEAACD